MRVAEAGARAVDLLLELVAIPSVTGSENAVVDFLEARYAGRGWTIDSIPAAAGRRNLFLHRGAARVVFTTHADTVPPFFPPRRDGDVLFARGSCDAKASLAAQALALEELTREGGEGGLLVLVGEERGSDGALAANVWPQRCEHLIGGEPTGNRFVAGSKGCLRVALEARGLAGHSSAPDSGRSAVLPLLDLLADLRALEIPPDPAFGPTTMNIGLLEAGTAPNVIADRARAEIVFRAGGPVGGLLSRIESLAVGRAEIRVAYRSDPIAFRLPRGETGEVASFSCDLPLLSSWGEPLLIGPGSILDAHAAEEKVDLAEVERAVAIYRDLARGLLSEGERFLETRRTEAGGPRDRPFTSGSPLRP